jgi:hypothetical protein
VALRHRFDPYAVHPPFVRPAGLPEIVLDGRELESEPGFERRDIGGISHLVEPLAHHGELLAERLVGVLDRDVNRLDVPAGDFGEDLRGPRSIDSPTNSSGFAMATAAA